MYEQRLRQKVRNLKTAGWLHSQKLDLTGTRESFLLKRTRRHLFVNLCSPWHDFYHMPTSGTTLRVEIHHKWIRWALLS
jgi:hypothetical protein